MQEPSVLDYVKSIFKDWKSFFGFLRSVFDAVQREEFNRRVAESARPAPLPVEVEPVALAVDSAPLFPWRALAALLLALAGQYSFESAIRQAGMGALLYLFAFGFAVWATLRGEWLLPVSPAASAAGDEEREPLTARLIPLALGVVYAILAWFDLGGDFQPAMPDNLFTWHNVLLWLLAVASFASAFWLRRRRTWVPPAPRSPQERRAAWLWAGLVLAAVVVVVFFRVYRLNGVPAEPFSDHAEKILDVYDITQGQPHIFFPRNTGREGLQMYLTLAVARVFQTGLSFLSLKIGTVLCGLLTLPYVYLLGKELGNKRVALLALLLVGMAYWPNVISRAGLRFPLYPLFVAPLLFYVLRGLRNQDRNDFVLAGLSLGLGLHGYSPFRIMPLLVVVAILLFVLHARTKQALARGVAWLAIVGLIALIVFLPLLRYAFDHPDLFSYRAFSRLGTVDQPLPGPALQVFLSNFWNGLRMFNWDDGEIWVHSIPHRPALDLASGALFLVGCVLLLVRYARTRRWQDLFLLLCVPLLQLPSTLSLAFPGENPALNRAGGAYIPAFLIVALALDGLAAGLRLKLSRRVGPLAASGLVVLLLAWSGWQNFDLVFNQYDLQFRSGAWNSSEMGQVIVDFRREHGQTDTVWIVAYPHWVDTRLPGVWAGIPDRDFALWPEQIVETLPASGPKLFMLRPDDTAGLETLQSVYPQGSLRRFMSATPSHDFLVYTVAAPNEP